NREPIESQPRFVADMGCGDGSWLVHLHGLIAEHTRRGKRSRVDPVLMVGIDYSPAALERARSVVDAADVPALLVHGDISDPDSVAFDAYHGYSHQYPIDHSAFVQCCRLAGLRPATDSERRYPATRPFVAVSLNRLLVPSSGSTLPGASASAVREDTWQPGPE